SFLECFPKLEWAILLSVIKHEMHLFEIVKLDLSLCLRADATGANPDAPHLLHKDFSDIISVLSCLSTYFCILTQHAAFCGHLDHGLQILDGSHCYANHLILLSLQYEWNAILSYCIEYHQHQHHEMENSDFTGWELASQELIMNYLAAHVHAPTSSS
ncbi:uncharacterized protein BT62DRAFT_832455, partial [Guyanagaster necrorhizus]